MCVYVCVCVWWEWLGRYSVGLYVVRVYGGRESFVNPHPRPIRSLIKPEKSVRPIKRGTVIRQNGRQRNLGRWSTFGSTVNVANGERFGDARPSVIAKPVFGNVGTRVPPNLGGSCPDSCRRHELQARFLPGRTREFGGNDPRTAERWPSGALVRRHRSRCDGGNYREKGRVKRTRHAPVRHNGNRYGFRPAVRLGDFLPKCKPKIVAGNSRRRVHDVW